MDPFSFATGSVSLVSIGITLCDGLVRYCRGYQSRHEDLLILSQHVDRLQEFLHLLDERLRGSSGTDSTLRSTVQSCLDACGLCMEDFKKLNDKYSQQNSTAGLKNYSKTVALKLQYPFQREKLQSFRQRMHDLHFALSSQVLLMNYDLTANLHRKTSSESNTLASLISIQGRDLSGQISGVVPPMKQAFDLEMSRLDGSLQIRLESLERSIKDSLKSLQIQATGQKDTSLGHNTTPGSDDELTGAPLPLQPTRSQRKAPGILGSSFHTRDQATTRRGAGSFSKVALFGTGCPCATSAGTHAKMCNYSFQNRRKWAFVGQLQLFNFLLKWEFVVQYSQYAFARDFQVYPNFTLRATCEWSPAFDLVYRCSWKMETGLAAEEMRKEIQTCLGSLRQTFTDRKAWPTDITTWGENLLHAACYGSRVFFTEETAAIFFQYLKELIALGVPINDGDRTPLYTFLFQSSLWTSQSRIQGTNLDSMHLTSRMAQELIDYGVEISTEAEIPFSSLGGLFHLPLHPRRMLDLPIPLEYGALSRALLQESEPEVCQLLSTSKLPMHERGPAGETPFHVTVCWARGLELLLKLGGDSTRTIMEAKDVSGNTPFQYALQLRQFETVRLFLEEDAGIDLEDTQNIESQGWNIPQSDEIISLLSHALASRRKKLSSFALEWLPNEETRNLNFEDSKIVQENASEVVDSLKRRSINIPRHYQNIQPGSIYHSSCMSVNLAEELFKAGFDHCDVDFQGLHPLMMVDLSYLTHRRGLESTLDLVDWFETHGADLESPIPTTVCGPGIPSNRESRCFKLMHRIAYEAGYGVYRTSILADDATRITQLRRILTNPAVDPCHCYCVHWGCTSASLFTRGIWDMVISVGIEPGPSKHLRRGVGLLQHIMLSGQVQAQVVMDIIRVSTFTRLGMKHTCCRHSQWSPYEYEQGMIHAILEEKYKMIEIMDSAEIDEIQEEDQHLAVRLEALVEEFDAKFTELCQPFDEFFFGYWRKRMDEVDEETDEFALGDVEAVLETGVILDDE